MIGGHKFRGSFPGKKKRRVPPPSIPTSAPAPSANAAARPPRVPKSILVRQAKGRPSGYQKNRAPVPERASVALHDGGPRIGQTKVYLPEGGGAGRREAKSTILVSAVLSIHNRGKLLRRALDGYMWQTMPPEWWEIVLVDDMSTEDLRWTYRHLVGRANIRHIRVDHTRHPLFAEMNPRGTPEDKPNWYHTPAITINIGASRAEGPIICLCHPEVLHAPTNFELAARRLSRQRAYLFGTTYLGTPKTNQWLDGSPEWTSKGWGSFLSSSGGASVQKFGKECYWYTSFLPREAVKAIGGVDFEYLRGAAAEDDDFRERVMLSGWQPMWAQEIEGLHQDHSDEKESHRDRTAPAWFAGLEKNRATYQRRKAEGFPVKANSWTRWDSPECVILEERYKIGSEQPEIVEGATA